MEPVKVLTLVEAAAFLRVHKTTLTERVKAGAVPAAKVGRAWVFIETDLIIYIREQYLCHSSKETKAISGGRDSRSPVMKGYVGQLEKLLGQRRKKSKTA